MKKILLTRTRVNSHWVGDGFPVRNFFSYSDIAEHLSPFLLLDYAGPKHFPPTEKRLGVGEHPHRGFETVTIVFSGEVEHRDSTGAGGTIGPGDVQWMTAASGIIHEEFHGREFARTGGPFEMIQLWVNLPSQFKMSPPAYQEIKAASIPTVELMDHAGSVRVIAGSHQGHAGPARTFTPMNLWEITLSAKKSARFRVTANETAALVLTHGTVTFSNAETLTGPALCVLEPEGEEFILDASEDSRLLFMGGKPLNEPIVGYGPFVMNTEDEIRQAFRDYQSGKMGARLGSSS